MATEKIDIILVTRNIFLDLAKGNGEVAWNIKMWGFAIWVALVSFAWKIESSEIVWIALIHLFVTYIWECSQRQIQFAFIKKGLVLEDAIKSFYFGEPIVPVQEMLSSNIGVPTIWDFLRSFKLKRWIIWFPYACILSVSVVLICLL